MGMVIDDHQHPAFGRGPAYSPLRTTSIDRSLAMSPGDQTFDLGAIEPSLLDASLGVARPCESLDASFGRLPKGTG
jgi:hypothetical protein